MDQQLLIRERISRVLSEKDITVNSLGHGNSAVCQKVFNQITKGKTITLDVIMIILNEIPDLNAEWLFRGIGNPFKDMSSVQEQINNLSDRLSVLEGERENAIQKADHTA